MIEISKLSLLKLLILLLLSVKLSSFLSDNISQNSIEKIINSCSDEMEIEVETEVSFFQKIPNKPTFMISEFIFEKVPVFKNTFSLKTNPLESITPPPEFLT